MEENCDSVRFIYFSIFTENIKNVCHFNGENEYRKWYIVSIWEGFRNSFIFLISEISSLANVIKQGRLKPKFYCVHSPFSVFSYWVRRLTYSGSAFGACVFKTRWTRLEPGLYLSIFVLEEISHQFCSKNWN